MSKQHDELVQVKLDAENKAAIDKHISKNPLKPSRVKVANLAIKIGLPKLKP